MTTFFVGPGGNNSNSGLTYALRRLTLTSIETLVAAGDTVYVAPGTYRETLTTTANGTSGNPITYIGDEGGTLTDGVGGAVRITGSDNDQTATRANGISGGHNYRTFRGLHVDTTTSIGISITGNNNIVDRCAVSSSAGGIQLSGASCNTCTVKRCVIMLTSGTGITITHSSTVDNTGHIVENCQIFSSQASGILISRIGGITIRNCLCAGNAYGIRCSVSPAGGQVNNVNNCIVAGNSTFGFLAVATTDITEDYNEVFANATARSNVSIGANSKAYTPLFVTPLLTLGIHSWIFGALDPLSQIASLAGTGVPSDDLFGTTRASPSSWGPIQYVAGQRAADAGPSHARKFGGI